jgi:hypothetical protein
VLRGLITIVAYRCLLSIHTCRAISTAVIVYELSGDAHLMLPLSGDCAHLLRLSSVNKFQNLVSLLVSFFVSNRLSKGIYDGLRGDAYLVIVVLQ